MAFMQLEKGLRGTNLVVVICTNKKRSEKYLQGHFHECAILEVLCVPSK